MRALLVGLFVVFASPSYAEDKDEDKAKEVATAFLKAVDAKDIDAVMKTVDVPFVLNFGSPKAKTLDKADELKEAMAKLVKEAEPDLIKSFKIGKVYDMPALAQYAKDKGVPEIAEQAEKLVGKSGRMVMIMEKKDETPFVLIRFKDGKALIASLGK